MRGGRGLRNKLRRINISHKRERDMDERDEAEDGEEQRNKGKGINRSGTYMYM